MSVLGFLSAEARAELEAMIEEAVERKLADTTPPEVSPYITIPEAADYLRCSRQRVDDLLSSGRLTRVKEGRRTLVRRDEVGAWLAEA